MGRNKKAEGESPTIAPLKKIVEHQQSYHLERKTVVLECGHQTTIPKNAYPRRTRCFACLQASINSWNDDHTCPHGVLMLTPDTLCKDCKIAELEAEVFRLRTIIGRGASRGARDD